MPQVSQALSSRFYQRWLAADPARTAQVEALSLLSLNALDLGAELTRLQAAPAGALRKSVV